MGRQLRIFMPGFAYHVVARGNERKEIFRDDGDRIKFLKLVEEAKERFRFRVYAYCLMSNHYHMLVELHDRDFWRAMQFLNSSYCRYFNKKYSRCGHLLQGRYFAGIVEHGPEIKFVTAYIHLNPARAYMVKQLNDYLWSSHRQFTGAAGGGTAEPELVLKYFSNTRREAVALYEKYLEEAALTDDSANKAKLYSDYVIGTEGFVREIKLMFKDKDLSYSINKRGELRKVFECEDVVSAAAGYLNVCRDELLFKKTKWNKGKGLLIYLLHADAGMTFTSISKLLGGQNPSAVGRRYLNVKDSIGHENGLRKHIESIRKMYTEKAVSQVSKQSLTPVFPYSET